MPASLILSAAYLATAEGMIVAFAINMVASAIVARVFAPDAPSIDSMSTPNPGNKATVPPAGDNKLPVIYGTSYSGGIVIDMTITSNSQQIYYVLALSEVTNTETGGTPDTFTFGDIFYAGKKVIFDNTDLTKVIALRDTSTGLDDTTVAGKINIYLYKNGSSQPTNTGNSAITVLSASDLVYKWDATKTMTNCVFAIVRLTYSVTANIRGLDQMRFQITNSRKAPGDCFLDYLSSSRYGAALTTAQIDTASLTALNTYSNTIINYIDYLGYTQTIKRFQFDGSLNTTQPIMTNIQLMATSCDCLVKYNEITGKWGVIVQQPIYTVAMALDNSNIVSGIQISPIDLSNSFNIAEVKYPDGSQQDSFASVTYDLAVLKPALLFPNEPVNKQQITLQFVNNDVRVQLLANRFLESCRDDLQVQLTIDFSGIQLEAGDIVTVTNANYGWVAKLFRVAKITERFADDGSVTAVLALLEFNPAVYDDKNITQFTPAPNTGLSSPLTFGTIPVPVVTSLQPTATNPSFQLNITTSSAGIVQYAEVWYSAYASPTTAQRIFAGTTAVNSNGNPYDPSTLMPVVTLAGIPAGNWYFFSRMVNQLGSSDFSGASSLLQWRPTTFTYGERYLIVAYADDLVGTGITATRTGKNYYGLYNSTNSTFSSTASNYTWYLAQPTFGTNYFLAYINRTGRTFSFGTSTAYYASGTASFVPTLPQYDQSIWSALPDGTNAIDLDIRTGQLTRTGTTSTGGGQISIVNNNDGTMVGSLQQFLDFGGSSTYTGTAATITIDIYGRVVGLIPPDGFYYSSQDFVAIAGQTVFTPTARQAGYINGQDFVFRNGVLLNGGDYTETTTTVTMVNACAVGDTVTIISVRSVSASAYYEPLNIYFASGTSTVTYTGLPYQIINAGDLLTFASTGTPTQYTVSTVNYTTKQITFTTSVSGVAVGASIYRYRAASLTYPSFSKYTTTLTAASSFTPTTYNLRSGYELLFLNGTIVNDQDYDLVGNTINNFPANATGLLTIIQWAENNQTVPNGLPTNVTTNTVNGQAIYTYSYDPNYFELYDNGLVFKAGTDYTTATGSYTMIPTPNSNLNLLVQQTFNGSGAA